MKDPVIHFTFSKTGHASVDFVSKSGREYLGIKPTNSTRSRIGDLSYKSDIKVTTGIYYSFTSMHFRKEWRDR